MNLNGILDLSFYLELYFPTGYNNNMFRKYRALHPELN